MATNYFQINELLSVDAPSLFLDRLVVSRKTAAEVFLQPDNNPFTKPEKILNFRLALKAFDNYNRLSKTGLWYNNSVISDFLKFKIIFATSEEQLANITVNLRDNPLSIINAESVDIKTFSLDDFKLENNADTTTSTGDANPNLVDLAGGSSARALRTAQISKNSNKTTTSTAFFIYPEIIINKQKIGDVQQLTCLIVPYLDPQEISKKFNLGLENTLDIQKYFIDVPKSLKIIENGLLLDKPDPETDTEIIDLTILEGLKESLIFPFKKKELKKFGSFFSDLFGTVDFNLNNKSTCTRFGFFFDKIRFVKENSVFPTVFNLRQSRNKIKILDIELTRLREDKITPNGGYEDKLITSGFNSTAVENGILYDSRNINYVREVDFYSGIDYSVSDLTNGKYKYKIKIKVHDPTYEILSEIVSSLKTALNGIQAYKTIMDIPIIQYNDIKDKNPYIDIEAENNKFIFKRYGHNTAENRYEIPEVESGISIEFLKNLVEQFVDGQPVRSTGLLGMVSTLALYLINIIKFYYLAIATNSTDVTREQLIKNTVGILPLILPPTGNPEGTQAVIDFTNFLIQIYEDLLSTAKPSAVESNRADVPNFIKTLEIEEIFHNFVYDAEITKNLAFNYHTTPTDNKTGLLYINENSVFDIFENGKTKKYKSLKQIFMPIKTSTSNPKQYTEVTIRNNFPRPPTYSPAFIDKDAASYIDLILSLYGTNQFDSIISANQDIFRDLPNISSDSAILKMAEAFREGFDILTENNISINYKNITNIKYDKNDIIVNNTRIPNELFGQNLYKKLSLGVLNYSKLTSDKNNTYLQAESEKLYDRDIYAKQNLNDFSKSLGSQQFLQYAGLYKLSNNTFKKASVIYFNISRAQNTPDYYNNGFYILKSPKYTNVQEVVGAIGDLLVVLDDYSEPDKNYLKNPYKNIPILNRYFMVSSTIARTKITITEDTSTAVPTQPESTTQSVFDETQTFALDEIPELNSSRNVIANDPITLAILSAQG